MARTRDLYEVLGVPRDASQDEIKRAYRRLAREYHPDVSDDPDAEHRIKEINLAYQTLSDPVKRRQYDMYGGEGFTPDMFDFMGDVTDIFEAFFGAPFGRRSGRRRRPSGRGQDLHVTVQLSFEEAAFGTERQVEVDTLAICEVCGGRGAEPGTSATRCSQCGGSGEVADVRRSVFGTVMTTRTCPTCRGAGEEISSPCRECRGDGRVSARKTVTVEIPAGVADGVELRMEDRGASGYRGGPPGDLYIGLSVAAHPVFQRRGQDLVTILDLPLTQAVLGAKVEVETLEGKEVVRIPPGTRSGTVIRLRGRGIPNLGRRGRGDLFLEVDVAIPESLSRKERGLVEELAELLEEEPGERPARGRLRRPS